MKKNNIFFGISIVISLFLGATFIFANFYRIKIAETYTMFLTGILTYVLAIVLIMVVIISIICSIIATKKNKSGRGIIPGTIILISFFISTQAFDLYLELDHKKHCSERMQIINEIVDGKYVIGEKGRVALDYENHPNLVADFDNRDIWPIQYMKNGDIVGFYFCVNPGSGLLGGSTGYFYMTDEVSQDNIETLYKISMIKKMGDNWYYVGLE